MNEVTLPPSPNWYLDSILACSKDGTVAWGARNAIVIGKQNENSKTLSYSIIKDAHKDRVTSLAFSPEYGQPNKNQLVSAGDECSVKIWNLDNLSVVMAYSYQDTNQNVIGVDWSQKDPNIIYCISAEGLLICWDVSCNTCYPILLGKLTATCLSACPHDSKLVAIGSKTGLVYIVETRGKGVIKYKLRGHDTEICSLSWCPVENNIINNENNKDLLLASGGKDRYVFIWKAGGDGRYQLQITLPTAPLEPRLHRGKSNISSGNWTVVCWVEPKLLLTSSSWGELLSWNFKTMSKNKPMCKLVHASHSRTLFSITMVPYTCEINNDNWRMKSSFRIRVWTLALDRQIVCCNMKEGGHEIEYNIPTQGGYVYCIAACPVDTSRIAFGVGDMMLRIWNLSEPHETSFDITMLWQKIKSNIRAIAWHPEKENLIAYGTTEGRIGVFDINGNKPPILYRQYYRKTVYTLRWGPHPKTGQYTLYCCGEGDLVYYDAESPNKEPTLVLGKKCTELSWKPDFSCLAIGLQNGTILFYNRDLQECGHLISTMNIGIHCLTWHPDSTATDLKFSPLRNYIAVAYDATTITVLDISDILDDIDEINVITESDDKTNDIQERTSKTVNKVIATLNGHNNKIVCLAWSPHFSGYLVSSSYDYTAQVWNVESQELIATFADHCGPVYCCMWSPINPDFIMTGSADFTLRLWKISSRSVIRPEKKSSLKKCRGKKNKQKIDKNMNKKLNNVFVGNENTPVEATEVEYATLESGTTESDVSTAIAREIKKAKPEKSQYFPTYTKIMNNKSSILKSIKHLIKDEEENSSLNSGCESEEHIAVTSLFAEDTDLVEVINKEKSILSTQGNYSAVTEMNMWYDNLKENLEAAVKEKRLNATLVALSPSLSMKIWRDMCEAYANQLILESKPNKAVPYLLSIHKTYEAIDVFQNVQMFKEAYCLAKSKLDSNDTMITTVLQNWANYEVEIGHFEGAAHCYVKLGEFSEAASLLARRKDVDSLKTAAKLAMLSNNTTLSKSLAKQAVIEALKNSDVSIAEDIILKFPQIKYLNVQVKVFKELKRIMEKRIEVCDIYGWLNDEFENGILQICENDSKEYEAYYDDLCQHGISNILPENQAELWTHVSLHLTMAILCNSTEKQLTHLIDVLNIISQFELLHRKYITTHGSLLIKVLSNLDSKSPTREESIFAPKCSLSKTLRAYLCHGLLNWIVDDICLFIDDETTEIMKLIEKLLENILEKEVVKYCSMTNEITKLQTKIASTIGTTPKEDENTNDEEHMLLLEKLDEIKNEKKRFITERVCTPSPVLVFSKSNELVNRYPNEKVLTEFATKLNEIWRRAIS